ncbi:MAG TPA: cytochrome c biogenesis protein CcsA, partial [Acidimicrobiales bacterium]
GFRGRASARWLLAGSAAGAAVATSILARALLTSDFSLAYVADHSRRDASGPYRVASLWGGMAGSLLWFSTLVGLVGWVVAGRVPNQPRAQAVVAAVPGALVAALCGLVLAFADPFQRLDLPAIEGAGLTPILEHPAMLYHPPLLYLGLASLVAPFSLVVAGLLVAPELLDSARRWLIVPWTLLALGMVAGAHWAYVELGWGGYWAWDPVENTALLPWLAATLAIHAWMLPTRRGFAALVCAGFLLALTGTMLTRSGAVPSVHAFGEDVAIGRGLAVLVGVAAVFVVWLLTASSRREQRQRRDGRTRLLRGHLAIVGAILAITFLGTVTPLVSELAGGDDIAVEGRYFASFAGPLAVVGLALAALVPLVRSNRRLATLPAGFALGLAALWLGGGHLDAGRIVLGATAGAALVSAMSAMVRQPGPHIAHAGLGLLLLGIAGTATGRTETFPVQPGDTIEVLGEKIEYRGVEAVNSSTVVADVHAAGHDLAPSLVAYPERHILLAETSLISTPRHDVQVALRDAQNDGSAVLQVGVHPLQLWVWWGALALVLAGILNARPVPRRRGPGIPDEHDRPFGLVDGGDDRIDVVAQAAPPPVDSRRPRLRRGRLVRGWGTTAQVSTGV